MDKEYLSDMIALCDVFLTLHIPKDDEVERAELFEIQRLRQLLTEKHKEL